MSSSKSGLSVHFAIAIHRIPEVSVFMTIVSGCNDVCYPRAHLRLNEVGSGRRSQGPLDRTIHKAFSYPDRSINFTRYLSSTIPYFELLSPSLRLPLSSNIVSLQGRYRTSRFRGR